LIMAAAGLILAGRGTGLGLIIGGAALALAAVAIPFGLEF
jgi:hypothetical protein